MNQTIPALAILGLSLVFVSVFLKRSITTIIVESVGYLLIATTILLIAIKIDREYTNLFQ